MKMICDRTLLSNAVAGVSLPLIHISEPTRH